VANIYTSSYRWTAAAAWTATTAYSLGNIVRQNATPTVGNERVWRCTTAGTSLGSEPAWTLTKGSTTTEAGGPVWTEITGQAIYNGDGGGTAWAAPHARLANALAWGAAGDTFYVGGGVSGANPHAETQATAITLTAPGTAASPNRILCVDEGAVPPTTLAATATISTTGNALSCPSAGFGYWYGLSFSVGANGGNALLVGGTGVSVANYYDTCTFLMPVNQFGPYITLGPAGGSGDKDCLSEFRNCSFAPQNQNGVLMRIGMGVVNIIGGSITNAGATTLNVFQSATGTGGIATIRDCDMSSLAVPLYSFSAANSSGRVHVQNTRIHASATMVTGTATGPGTSFRLENTDSGNTNYRYYMNCNGSSVQQETTIIRTGGDTDGTTPLSWKVITGANAKLLQPFELDPLVAWNTLTGSRTLTVEIASGGTLTNGDIWVEAEYPSSASYPLGSTVSSRVAGALTTVANVTTSAASWASSPGTTQKLQVTISPAVVGPVKARVFVGKASATLYVDPIFTIT
jgi:hypothetical protein